MPGICGTGGTDDLDSTGMFEVVEAGALPGNVKSCCGVMSLEPQVELRPGPPISNDSRPGPCPPMEIGVVDLLVSPLTIIARPASSMTVDVRAPFPRRLTSRRSEKLGVVGRPIVIGVFFRDGGDTC